MSIREFTHTKFGKIRTVTLDGSAWPVGADVCKVLKIDKVHMRKLKADEKRLYTMPLLFGVQKMIIVNEKGLRSLLRLSRNSEANNWLMHEIFTSESEIPFRVAKNVFVDKNLHYDSSSPQARKGAFGEQIVKEILERDGWHVQKPDGVSEDTATHIDWLCTRGNKVRCVEVKTVKKFLYSFVELPTFKIPLAKYEAYKAEAEKRGGVLELWFVSSEDAKIYWATSDTLDGKNFGRAGFNFPTTIKFSNGDSGICFHVEQFSCYLIAVDDLAKLRALDAEMKDIAEAELQRRDVVTA